MTNVSTHRILSALVLVLVALAAFPTVQGISAPRVAALVDINCEVRTNLGAWENEAKFYVESESASATPFLSHNPDSGPGDAYNAVSDPASGVSTTANTVRGTPGPTIKIPIKGGMGDKLWLNLSKPVAGVLYVSSSTLAAGKDMTTLRIELWQGETRMGGQLCLYTVAADAPTWTPMYLRFRPEFRLIDPASPFELRVTWSGGLSDFSIGTGGTHQSVLEFRGYPFDPLEGTLYLADRKLLHGIQESEEGLLALEQAISNGAADGEWSGIKFVPSAHEGPRESQWVILGVAPLGLIVLGVLRPRHTRVLVAAVVLLGVAFAGCLSDPMAGVSRSQEEPDGTEPAKPTVEVELREDEKLLEKGVGEIRGQVKDEIALPISDANVLVPGTSLYQKTAGEGRFQFINISAGTYLLHVDREGFDILEENVLVEIGKITYANVTLTRPAAKTQNDKPHLHDEFPASGIQPLWSDNFNLDSAAGGQATGTSNWRCLYFQGCETLIPVDPVGHPVLSGTGLVKVVLKFTTPSDGFKEIGLRITTTGNASGDQFFLPRPTGVPFLIPIFPDEADPGHSKFTNWVFYAYVASTGSVYNPGPLVTSGTRIVIEAEAIKGVVPYEPAHRDFWKGGDEIELFTISRLTGACSNCDYPSLTYKWDLTAAAQKGIYVPPGTSEITGTMTWTSSHGAPASPTAWKVAYKPANSPAAKPTYKAPTTVTPGTNKVDFVIKVDPLDVDQFYQRVSQWYFLPDDGAPPVAGANGVSSGADTFWFLTATAHRDPAYTNS